MQLADLASRIARSARNEGALINDGTARLKPCPNRAFHRSRSTSFANTQATIMNDFGVPSNIIADRLGHASPLTTIKHYTQKTASAEAAALASL